MIPLISIIIESLSRKTRELVMKSMPFLEESEAASKSERDMIFYGAPLLIFISVKKSPNPLWRVVNFLDCGLAAQNMFLFAFQEGLGSCFIGYPKEVPEAMPREAKVLRWI